MLLLSFERREIFLFWLAVATTTASAFSPSTISREGFSTRNSGIVRRSGNVRFITQTSRHRKTKATRRVVLLSMASSSSPSSSSPSSSSSTTSLNSWTPPEHWKFVGIRRRRGTTSSSGSGSGSGSGSCSSSTSRGSYYADDGGYIDDYYSDQAADGAVMPDGGLNPCIIKVIGVGGGGCNAVDRMLDTAVGGVDFWALNTDAQALGRSKARGAKVLNIGSDVTRGLGAGGNPDIGRAAAEESRKEIAAMVTGTDLCFVTSGMGGGTGSGAAPVVAEVAQEEGCLTVGIVTKPFVFEGKRRMRQAISAIERLRQNVDTVIVVSNDRLLEIIPDDTPMERAFAVADDILRQGVVGISDIIVKPGLINVDFADVRSVMSGAGTALMGIGIGGGKTAAEDAAAAAISSPLLDSTIENAKGVVFNISGGQGLTLNEVNQAAKLIYSTVEADANVIFGALVDETLEDNISITVLATGFSTVGDEAEREMIEAAKQEQQLLQQQQQQYYYQKQDDSSDKLNDVVRDGLMAKKEQKDSQLQQQQQQGIEDEIPPPPRKSSSRFSSPGRKGRGGRGKRGGNNEDGDGKIPDFLRNLKKRR